MLAALGMTAFPAEIIQEIFLYRLAVRTPPPWHDASLETVDPPIISSRSQTSSYQRGLLMLVCRQWNDLICACSMFWQDVQISPYTNRESVRVHMERSGTLPLHVSCIFSAAYRAAFTPKPLTLSIVDQCSLVSTSLASLAPSATRWCSLVIAAEDAATIDACLYALDSSVSLHIIDNISVVFTGYDTTSAQAIRSFQYTFPPVALNSAARGTTAFFQPRSLTTLTLRRCRVAWRSMEALACCLVELNVDAPLDPISVPRFIALLAQSPSLCHILVGGDFLRHPGAASFPARSVKSDPTQLQSVRTLILRDVPPSKIMSLLMHTRLPVIDKLGLDLRYKPIGDDASDHAEVLSLLSSPSESDSTPWTRVRTLYLRRAELQAPLLFQPQPFFLPSFDHLGQLTLDFRTLQIRYWVWLLECPAQGALASLHTLSVAGLSALDLQEYICIRHDYTLPLLRLSLVASFAPDEERLWLGWLRANTTSCTVHQE